MTDADCNWVNKELMNLESIISILDPWSLFSPTNSFYEKLASGNQRELQNVVDLLAEKLKLSYVPTAKYDWSLKIPSNSVGQIKDPGSEVSVIQIPFSSVGKPLAIGAILAHEISHQFLYSNKIYYSDLAENERLTDLASIAFGFGKLVLNGVALEASGVKEFSVAFGYIGTESKFFSYLVTCRQHSISKFDIYYYLAKDIEYLLKEFTSNNKRAVHRIAKQLRKNNKKKVI